jgi:hypothetical protein
MFWTYAITSVFFVVNAILSGVLIFNDYFLDVRSATVYVTNILLLGGKMYTGTTLAFSAKQKEIAYSFYLTEPVNWNVLDSTAPRSFEPEQPAPSKLGAPRDPEMAEALPQVPAQQLVELELGEPTPYAPL